jgi:hypothetical protein
MAIKTGQIKAVGSVFRFRDDPEVSRNGRNPAWRRAWARFAGESGRMRSEVPPPGRAMSFPEWAEAIVGAVRRYLPDARAVRKGASREPTVARIALDYPVMVSTLAPVSVRVASWRKGTFTSSPAQTDNSRS